jgi:glutathione S-transferase
LGTEIRVKLFDWLPSGNGYKVRLLLAQLGQRFAYEEIDITRGETRTPEFLARNPNGRIPLLELEPGVYLAESNAIQWYLAEGTDFVPRERLARAQVLQWMFFEQYSHEPYIAVVRHWVQTGQADGRPDLDERRQRGAAALTVMERHLAGRSFLVGDRYTIADIALYAYTHVAPEGGFELAPYPAVRAWLERVRAEPGHVPITWRPA